jgi:hypothetical protein
MGVLDEGVLISILSEWLDDRSTIEQSRCIVSGSPELRLAELGLRFKVAPVVPMSCENPRYVCISGVITSKPLTLVECLGIVLQRYERLRDL